MTHKYLVEAGLMLTNCKVFTRAEHRKYVELWPASDMQYKNSAHCREGAMKQTIVLSRCINARWKIARKRSRD